MLEGTRFYTGNVVDSVYEDGGLRRRLCVGRAYTNAGIL